MADLGEGTALPPPPLFRGKKEEITEGRRANRVSKTKPHSHPPLSSKSGSATESLRNLGCWRYLSLELVIVRVWNIFTELCFKHRFHVSQCLNQLWVAGKTKKALNTGKNNGFPILVILGHVKNTHKNPKFGRVRQIPIWELGWEFTDWNLSHSPKFGIFVGIL